MHPTTLFRHLTRLGLVPRRVWLTPEQADQVDAWHAENMAKVKQ
jgi:hypothetical protein